MPNFLIKKNEEGFFLYAKLINPILQKLPYGKGASFKQ